jgi:hypothetical protein
MYAAGIFPLRNYWDSRLQDLGQTLNPKTLATLFCFLCFSIADCMQKKHGIHI